VGVLQLIPNTLGAEMGEIVKKLGVIVLVAMGLLAILQGVSYFGIIMQMASSGPESGVSPVANAAAYAVPAVGAFLIGFLLIAFRARLADRWFEDGEIAVSVDATSLVRVAIIAMGVWMVAFGIPAVLGSVIYGLTSAAQGLAQGMGPSVYDMLPRALPEALMIVIGVILVARSAPLSRRLWEVRPAIAEPATQELPACPNCGTQYDPDDYRDAESAKCSRCKEPLPRSQQRYRASGQKVD
jgi:uncharacterized paraquat-inducible protein A